MAKKDKKDTKATKEGVEEVVEETKEEVEVEAVKLDRAEKEIVKEKVPPKEEKEETLVQRI